MWVVQTDATHTQAVAATDLVGGWSPTGALGLELTTLDHWVAVKARLDLLAAGYQARTPR